MPSQAFIVERSVHPVRVARKARVASPSRSVNAAFRDDRVERHVVHLASEAIDT